MSDNEGTASWFNFKKVPFRVPASKLPRNEAKNKKRKVEPVGVLIVEEKRDLKKGRAKLQLTIKRAAPYQIERKREKLKKRSHVRLMKHLERRREKDNKKPERPR